MKNPYLKNLKKIEFVVTYACTGRCKHCSEGDHVVCGDHIDPIVAADAVRKIAAEYDVSTVMAFGGEPLLYPDAACAIMEAAKDMNIPKRQIITNGYFSKNPEMIRKTAKRLYEVGVNDVLLSVDAFHQEYIPLNIVQKFAAELCALGVRVRLQPAWLVSPADFNPYNQNTRALLESFRGMGLSVNEGNVVFPEGNAKKYLADYFTSVIPANPYVEDPYDVKCISFAPNGDVLGGNVYECDMTTLIDCYRPHNA